MMILSCSKTFTYDCDAAWIRWDTMSQRDGRTDRQNSHINVTSQYANA